MASKGNEKKLQKQKTVGQKCKGLFSRKRKSEKSTAINEMNHKQETECQIKSQDELNNLRDQGEIKKNGEDHPMSKIQGELHNFPEPKEDIELSSKTQGQIEDQINPLPEVTLDRDGLTRILRSLGMDDVDIQALFHINGIDDQVKMSWDEVDKILQDWKELLRVKALFKFEFEQVRIKIELEKVRDAISSLQVQVRELKDLQNPESTA